MLDNIDFLKSKLEEIQTMLDYYNLMEKKSEKHQQIIDKLLEEYLKIKTRIKEFENFDKLIFKT
jgi:hypothetical protein